MRILFDKNVPAGVRTFLSGHYVRTFVQMHWHPQLENGDLLELAEFDVVVTSDQNIQYQQNLKGAEAVTGGARIGRIVEVESGICKG